VPRNISLFIDITCFLLVQPNKPHSPALLTSNLAANCQSTSSWLLSPLCNSTPPPLTRATPPTPFPVVIDRTTKKVYFCWLSNLNSQKFSLISDEKKRPQRNRESQISLPN